MRIDPRLSLSKKILFSLVPLLAAVLLLETYFRLFPFHKDGGKSLSGFVIPDRELGWRLQPRAKGPLATNELGFRDSPFNRDAPRKILLLGDSISWGASITDIREVYPYLLEQLLIERTGETYEVVNASVPGYSTFQQLRYLEIHGTEFDYDLVILQFCLNDVVERYSTLAQYGGDNAHLGIDTKKIIPGLHGLLFRNSRAFEALTRLLIKLTRRQEEYDVKKLASDRLSSELESAWDLTLSEIEGIADVAARNGTPLLIVIAPYRFQLGQSRHTSQPQQVLRRFGRERDIPMLDLLPYFEATHTKIGDLSLFCDANHFSIDGHALASQILVQVILKLREKDSLERNSPPHPSPVKMKIE